MSWPLVAIAGGGPAGSATALALRRRGIPVILFDKARFPRDKICGDVLLPATLDALKALSLSLDELKAISYECSGCRYHATTGREVAGLFRDRQGQPRASWTMPRFRFDAWLLEKARSAGAEIREGQTVVGFVDQKEKVRLEIRDSEGKTTWPEASFLVGADGASSVVARQLGFLRHDPAHTCLAVRGYAAGLRLPEPYLEVFTTEQTLPGCAWILPVGPNSANVGLGILKITAQRAKRTPSVLFHETVAAIPSLAKRLDGAVLKDLRGWPLPGATERRPVVSGRCLLVGDAGAMIDPFTGHGIHHALMAGKMAAETIADAVQRQDFSNDALAGYARAVAKLLHTEVSLGAKLQRIHASPLAMRWFTRLAQSHHGFRETFLGLVGHTADRSDLLSAQHLGQALFRWTEGKPL